MSILIVNLVTLVIAGIAMKDSIGLAVKVQEQLAKVHPDTVDVKGKTASFTYDDLGSDK